MFKRRFLSLFLAGFFVFLYLFLRVGFPETIEFGYDQPRVISTVVSMMEDGKYLDAMNYVYLSPYGQRSWFSLFLYFFVPLLLISKDPVVISLMIALYNGLGLILAYLLGKKLFGGKVALFGVFLMIVSPWHVVFSRMIYNPSVSLTTVIIGYYLVASIYEGKKWPWLFLPLSLGAMAQIYVVSGGSSALAILTLGLLFLRRRIDLKRLCLGIILGLLIWIPVIRYDFLHDNEDIKRLFTPSILWEDKTYFERGSEVFMTYLNNSSYSDFHFQLGYAYKDFMEGLPSVYRYWMFGFLGLVSVSLVYLTVRIILTRRFSYALIFFWILAPLAFLTIYKIPGILPRYLWVLIPPTSFIISDFLVKVSGCLFKKWANFAIIGIGLLISILNVNFITNYFNFVLNFQGYNGLFSSVSDPPIIFMERALRYALDDAKKSGYDYISVASDEKVKNSFSMGWSARYIWRYVLKRDENIGFGDRSLHYVIKDGIAPDGVQYYVRFGPYVVFRN